MSATPHAHTIRLPFVQSLTLMCLLTSFHGPPCVADGDPMFVGHQLLHTSTTTFFVQRDPGSENERRVHDDLRKHTPCLRHRSAASCPFLLWMLHRYVDHSDVTAALYKA
ncbi:hypothetical protein MRX96_001128 [Rhipicephalus microplus]